MLPYWLLFAFFAIGALLTFRRSAALDVAPGPSREGLSGGSPATDPRTGPIFALGLLVLVLMIGLRYEVGGDWFSYERMFDRGRLLDFGQQISLGDPGYQALNWLVGQAGGELWMVNLVCAAVFCWGLGRLARVQFDPWLAMVVAIPYLVVVVGMGYTRQGAALGIVMAGLASVFGGAGLLRFVFYVALATSFHKTAIIALPLLAFVYPRSRMTTLVTIIAVSLSLYVFFIQDSVDFLSRNYLEERLASQGAVIRLAQLGMAAIIFFVARSALRFPDIQDRVWRNYTVAALAMAALLVLSPSSTAIDRISLNLMPLQLAVLSRLPVWITNPVAARVIVVAYSAATLFVWLNYAVHAGDWLPYQTIFVEDGRR